MKAITINVSTPTYRWFQHVAKLQDRSTSELIRQAMEDFKTKHSYKQSSLAELRPLSVGEIKRPYNGRNDLFDEMINGRGDEGDWD